MIHFFHGENDFLIRRAVDLETSEFVKEFGADSITKINADEIDATKLISEIVNINMFAPRRLIVVSGAENSKIVWEKLGENLSRVPDETDLIIVAANPDKRTKTFKNLQKAAGETREFLNPKPYEMNKFVLDEANLQCVEIRPAALRKLIDLTSGDGENQLARIAAEIAKVSALKSVIDVDLIEKIVEPDIAGNVFAILQKSLDSQRAEVKKEIQILRASGENANKFFGLLASQIFALTGAVFGGETAAADLKINPYQMKNARELARRIGDQNEQKSRVKKIVKTLADTDAKMKLSKPDDAWVLVEVMLARFG